MRRNLIVLLLFAASAFASAQPALPAVCEAFRPVELTGTRKSLTVKQSDIDKFLARSSYGQTGKPTTDYWMVLSDRDRNPVYGAETGNNIIGYLEWNQEVCIAKVSNGRALVLSGSFNKADYPKTPINAKCLGWVPMSKLLLWETCPTDDAGIYYKALISINLDAAGIRNSTKAGKLYGNPDDLTKSQDLTTDKKFYYIMKRENDMVLLATQYTVSAGHSNKVLFGWVADGSYVPWNQRSCLEPSWDYEDVTYFMTNSIASPIYPDAKTTKSVTRWEYSIQKNWPDYRMSGNELRFPLLDGSETDSQGNIIKYHLSSFGTSTGEIIEDVPIGSGERLGIAQEALEEMKKINICIVIDGTESMKPYYPAVKEAIKEGCKLFQGKSVRVSVVIYRDKEHILDGKSFEVEEFRFTKPENVKLMQFLDSGGYYGFRSSSDKTAEESLFHGMSVGADMFKGKEKESNIMLVVGDCGNNASDKDNRYTESDIIRKLVDRNIQLMAFQVAKKSIPRAYGTFTNQLSKILKSNLEQKYSALEAMGVKSVAKVAMKPVVGGYELENSESNIYIGSIRFPLPEHSMEVKELTTEMITSIDYIDKNIQNQLDLIVSNEKGGWKSNRNVQGGMTYDDAFVASRLGEEAAKKGGVVMSFKGYTPKVEPKSGREYYKPVLFISSDELKTLIMKLQPVANEALRPSGVRKTYQDALKALIRSFVPDIQPEQMENMTQDEVMAVAAGLNEASSSVRGYSIAAIGDPHIVPEGKYRSILNNFANKFKRLKNINSSAYPYTMEFNGAKYYWIPIEELP